MEKAMIYLAVALGSALGGVSRCWLAAWSSSRWGDGFPWGTLIINVSGSFVIGFFAAVTGPEGRWVVSPRFNAFFVAGVCGGYTTFSSFSLQTLQLATHRGALSAGANVLASVALCLAAVWIGSMAGHALNR
jgi:CrcB protein